MSLQCNISTIGKKLVNLQEFHTSPVFGAPVGVTPFEFNQHLGLQKTIESMKRCFRNPSFSHFDSITTCDIVRQTDWHKTTAHTALA